MHDDREIVERRIRRAVRDRIRPAIHGASVPLTIEAWVVPGEPVPVAQALAATYQPFSVGGRWGRPWGTTWFRMTGAVPESWSGATVEAIVDLAFGPGPGFQAEGAVYAADGTGPLRGVHPLHQAIPINVVGGGPEISFLVEAAANPIIGLSQDPTPLGDPATAGDDLIYRLLRAELAIRNDDVWHLDLDLQILIHLMTDLAVDDSHRHELLRAIERALDRLDFHDVAGTATAARDELAPALAQRAASTAHTVTAVGHAHIDTAWLWPLRETRRKCARTFSSAVTWMETDYPEYRFACSQAVQYSWIEDDHPELFERIRTQVEAGRFIPVGSMWVEADCNLPSGESLARQFVHGKRYFEDRFGIETTEVWIPDVFGYAGNLPQLMRLAGCDRFLTQKLSWNKTNPFPHHSFWWEGIDGTQIFTHFPPVDTYNAEIRPNELRYAQRNFRDKGGATHTLMPFGHGDGGGGPTREMLERARRVADLAGLPKLRIDSPDQFFTDAIAEYGATAATWRGELYFEMHRGTYTSQAKTKQGNRRGELALRALELWSATTGTADLDALDRLWKSLLVHQFHDIIPGSSIAWVHDDTERDHAALLAETDERITAVLAELGSGTVRVAANASPFAVRAVIDVDDGDGPPVAWVDAPAMGVGTVSDSLPADVEPVRRVAERVFDNGLIRVTIGADGRLDSMVDLRVGRELLAAPANELQLFADHPNEYDAWDVDHFTTAAEPMLLTDVEDMFQLSGGGLEATFCVQRRFGDSFIAQTYRMTAGSARLDIGTKVDWHENEKLLKAAFPLDVQANDARYDVQFGHVRRPLHRNTSWDAARFEVCGHFWADISEPDFGVALLNDSKYGHDGLGSTLRLTLLRAANYPDPDADRGHHEFTYSLLPHDGRVTSILPEAWALNLPPRLSTGSPAAPIVAVDHPAVVVSAVKLADDGSGDLIVRVHEAAGGRAPFTLSVRGVKKAAVVCDLLERPIADAVAEPLVGGRLSRKLRAFQVETYRLS
jgi:alpha-mannosidase